MNNISKDYYTISRKISEMYMFMFSEVGKVDKYLFPEVMERIKSNNLTDRIFDSLNLIIFRKYDK